MKHITVATPPIRFKRYTDPWKQYKLGNIVTEVTRTDETSDAPVMMITAENGFIKQSDRYAYNNSGKSLKKYILLKQGELAYNHGASKLRPYGSCFPLITEKEARIPFVYHCFTANQDNARFLSFLLNGESVERQLKKLVSSGARMDGLLNISFNEYESVLLNLPSKDEEDEIANYLDRLDSCINLYQNKLEQQKKVKKYFLQNMFPKKGEKVPKIRLKGFTDNWNNHKLLDIANRYDNLRIPVASNLRIHGNTPYYGANGIQDYVDGYTHDGEFVLVAEDGASDLYNYPVFYVNGRIWVNNHAHVLQGIVGIVDTKFLSYSISQSDIVSLLVGGGRAKLNAEILMKIDVIIPDIKEQIQIGNYLAIIDHIIILQQHKIEELQMLKKYTLQNMLI